MSLKTVVYPTVTTREEHAGLSLLECSDCGLFKTVETPKAAAVATIHENTPHFVRHFPTPLAKRFGIDL